MNSLIQTFNNLLPQEEKEEFNKLIKKIQNNHKFYLINKFLLSTLKEAMNEKNDELSMKVSRIIRMHEMEKYKDNEGNSLVDLMDLEINSNQFKLSESEIENIHLMINIKVNEKISEIKINMDNENPHVHLNKLENELIKNMKELKEIYHDYEELLKVGEEKFNEAQELLNQVDNLSHDIDTSSYYSSLLNFTRLRYMDYKLKTKVYIQEKETEEALNKLENWYDNQLAIHKAKLDNVSSRRQEYNRACLSLEYRNLLKEYLDLCENIKQKEGILKDLE